MCASHCRLQSSAAACKKPRPQGPPHPHLRLHGGLHLSHHVRHARLVGLVQAGVGSLGKHLRATGARPKRSEETGVSSACAPRSATRCRTQGSLIVQVPETQISINVERPQTQHALVQLYAFCMLVLSMFFMPPIRRRGTELSSYGPAIRWRLRKYGPQRRRPGSCMEVT